jgi:hypothetical protein
MRVCLPLLLCRYTHEFMQLPPEDFERRIFIKENATWLLEQELRQVRAHEEIALGTATDPYQPVERRAKVTQSLLEVLARQQGLRIGVVTKSTPIERDIPLLQRIAERNTLVLHLTITTPNAALARLIEPRAPRPDLWLRTVARLREAGPEHRYIVLAAVTGHHRYRQGAGWDGEKSKGGRRELFLRPATLSQALFEGDLPGVCPGAFSLARAHVPAALR